MSDDDDDDVYAYIGFQAENYHPTSHERGLCCPHTIGSVLTVYRKNSIGFVICGRQGILLEKTPFLNGKMLLKAVSHTMQHDRVIRRQMLKEGNLNICCVHGHREYPIERPNFISAVIIDVRKTHPRFLYPHTFSAINRCFHLENKNENVTRSCAIRERYWYCTTF